MENPWVGEQQIDSQQTTHWPPQPGRIRPKGLTLGVAFTRPCPNFIFFECRLCARQVVKHLAGTVSFTPHRSDRLSYNPTLPNSGSKRLTSQNIQPPPYYQVGKLKWEEESCSMASGTILTEQDEDPVHTFHAELTKAVWWRRTDIGLWGQKQGCSSGHIVHFLWRQELLRPNAGSALNNVWPQASSFTFPSMYVLLQMDEEYLTR